MVTTVVEDWERREICASRVEGRDFVTFDARWCVKDCDAGVLLEYELLMKPFPLFPMALVDRKMYREMPRMLAAIREEVLVGKWVPFDSDERSVD